MWGFWMIENLRANWGAMEPAKQRKIILGTAVIGFFVVLVGAQIVTKALKSSGAGVGGRPSAIESTEISLQSNPDMDWLQESLDQNASLERDELRAALGGLNDQLKFISDDQRDALEGIQTSIRSLEDTSKRTQLDIAREVANRKAADELLIQRLSTYSGSSSLQVGGSYGQEGQIAFAPEASASSGVSLPAMKPLKVSAFDLATIAQNNNVQLAYPTPPQVNMLDESVKPTASDADRMGNKPAQASTGGADMPQTSAPGKTKKSVELARIPAGSLMTARLVSGVDAMVANSANVSNQFAVAKLTDPVLLPNGHKVDLRGCVVLVASMGELSTERVYFNTSLISCMDKKGVAYESAFQANALGEDGKLGLRGVVVTRDGALVMKSMQVGLLEGFATAFGDASSSQNTVVTSADGAFALPSGSYVAKTGLASGVSSALEQMVQRFNNILDQIFPVIQIDSGRRIEFVVQGSFVLKEV